MKGKLLLISSLLSLCIAFSAANAFAQCGADGTQPCNTTNRTTKKTTNKKTTAKPPVIKPATVTKTKTKNLLKSQITTARGGGLFWLP